MGHEGGSQAPKTTSNGSNNNVSDPKRGGDDSDGGDGNDNDEANGGDRNSCDENVHGDGHSRNNDDEDDESSLDIPTKGWEEFDEDAVYQKKHVDPEMRQWVLTNDCRRIISDKFFNNPVDERGTCNLFMEK